MAGRNRTLMGERAIAKPKFPLPQVFDRSPTELSIEKVPLRDQRAHFYQKDTTGSGRPVYGFIITAEESDGGSH